MTHNFISKNLCCLLIVVFTGYTKAQDIPAPAPAQQERISIRGGTLHVGNGKVLENALITFEQGKITQVISANTIKTDETLGKVIDATGKHIYPGLIALNTVLGLVEIEAVRATNDQYESGSINPNVRAVISYNTDSRVTPTVRSNGILYAQVVPQGGRISGTSSLMQLDAWNWEDAVIQEEDGIFLSWPGMYRIKGWWAQPGGYELNKDYEKEVMQLRDYFREAKSYATTTHEKKNLRFEAMRSVFSGAKNLYIRTDYVKEMLHAIAFAEEFGLTPVIVGGKDSYLIADALAQKKVAVILSKPHELPSYNDEDIEQPYKTPAQLQQAGVLFAISIDGFWQQRNLAFEAGTAVSYGLSKEDALAAITLNAARITKQDARIGTLEEGKDASLLISIGDIFDMRTSKIERAFIAGRDINLGNKQTDLYEKFLAKYKLK